MAAFKAKQINQQNHTVTTFITYQDCLAKTCRLSDGTAIAGRGVFEHCVIVGEVAKQLLALIPSSLRKKLFPAGTELLAAAHDIGKVSVRFQNKLKKAMDSRLMLNGDDRNWNGHGGVTFLTLLELINEKSAVAAGQHHGRYPHLAKTEIIDPEHSELLGGEGYHSQRLALIEALKTHFQTDFPILANEQQVLAVSGLITVADWIGSGELFEDPNQNWQQFITPAILQAGYQALTIRSDLSFETIFGFKPHSAQQQLFEQVNQPGIYVLEAPRGMGKTEAALYAAYKMLQNGAATGFYFALPTQLTSNKIYQRGNEFLAQILDSTCLQQALLIHGSAWLQQFEMGEDAAAGGAWFNQHKRAVLAPFGVGTIDQILLSVMRVKHGFVRAFGLVGKVVILDEIHSYDLYTGVLVQRLISVLRELGCSVIILSATLTRQRRLELLGLEPTKYPPREIPEAYPLISVSNADHLYRTLAVAPPASRSISLQNTTRQTALEEALLRAEQGQQVLWIENTVAEAQETYQIMAARCSGMEVKCGLLHSRFTAQDRDNNEAEWIDLYGKAGWENIESAPRLLQGRILIGTQVLEQSIDIDADFLVSNFAPSDMLLQRLGRLWRHAGTPRVPSAKAEAWLIMPASQHAIDDPIKAFSVSAFVYAPYVLCRSLLVWEHLTSITLPDDIRQILEMTYAERDENGKLAQWQHYLEDGNQSYGFPKSRGRKQLQQLALAAQMNQGFAEDDDKVQTRFSEQDSQDILLLRHVRTLETEKATELTFLDGSMLKLPLNGRRLPRKLQKQYAAQLMQHKVSINAQNAPKAQTVGSLSFLKDYCYLGGKKKEERSSLVVAIVSDDGALTGCSLFHLECPKPLFYSPDIGLNIQK